MWYFFDNIEVAKQRVSIYVCIVRYVCFSIIVYRIISSKNKKNIEILLGALLFFFGSVQGCRRKEEGSLVIFTGNRLQLPGFCSLFEASKKRNNAISNRLSVWYLALFDTWKQRNSAISAKIFIYYLSDMFNFRYIERYRNIPNYIEIHRNTSKHIEIHRGISKHIEIHRNTSEYIEIHRNTSKYIEIYRNKSKYIEMHRNTSKYIKILLSARFFFWFWRMYRKKYIEIYRNISKYYWARFFVFLVLASGIGKKRGQSGDEHVQRAARSVHRRRHLETGDLPRSGEVSPDHRRQGACRVYISIYLSGCGVVRAVGR